MEMDVPDSDGEAIAVGDLLVEVRRQRVSRSGAEINLPSLSFELLLALIRASPDTLSNDLLMERVWPGLVVTPETVAKRVNLLRDSLGDDAKSPRYIAGIRNRGYRLVASVTPVSRMAPPVEDPPPATTGEARGRSRHWWYAVPALLIALFAIAVSVRRASSHLEPTGSPTPERPVTDATVANTQARTVAVLPFDNISAEAGDAYLAQGFPEMILNRLSRVDGLSVIARTSSFALPIRNMDSRAIGRRLGSGYLVSGSVQREAQRLRVAAQLVESGSGTLVWSAHFDRQVRDIFSVEDEISDQIANALSLRTGSGVANLPASTQSANLEAYLSYLRGRALLGRFTVAESEAAVPFFDKAIALDPNFAPAYASLYDARMQAANGRRQDLNKARRQYRPLIDKALRLDPSLGAAYFARAMWAEQPYDATSTADNPLVTVRERDFRQGAALDPSNGRGLDAYASFLHDMLDLGEEGRTILDRALRVDPMSPKLRFAAAEYDWLESGSHVAHQKILQVLELDPNFVPALHRFGEYRWLQDGKLAEAIQILEHAVALDPEDTIVRQHTMNVYLDLGDVQAARAIAGRMASLRDQGPLAMYQGDWRSAGLAAFDDSSWTTDYTDDASCEFWQGTALRDYALKTGELKRTIAFMKLKYYFADAPGSHLNACNFRDAVYLSQLMVAAGQSDAAHSLRRSVAAWNDANESKFLGDSHLVRAQLLLLDGNRDAALAELPKSFQSGFYTQWWYTLNYDPLWLPLHGDPRFQAIAADVRRYIDTQRLVLDSLRQRGTVPVRDGRQATH